MKSCAIILLSVIVAVTAQNATVAPTPAPPGTTPAPPGPAPPAPTPAPPGPTAAPPAPPATTPKPAPKPKLTLTQQVAEQKRAIEVQKKFITQLQGMVKKQQERLTFDQNRLQELNLAVEKEREVRQRQQEYLDQQRQMMEDLMNNMGE